MIYSIRFEVREMNDEKYLTDDEGRIRKLLRRLRRLRRRKEEKKY